MNANKYVKKNGRRSLYHFTDNRNLDSIREHGLLAYRELIKRGVEIPAPGGNEWSHDADNRRGLDRSVHLSFLDQHPMCFVAQQDKRIDKVTILEISPEALLIPGVKFTLDTSNKCGVRLVNFKEWYDGFDFEVAFEFEGMKWGDPDVQKRRQKACRSEILVPIEIPVNLIKRGI